MTNNAYTILSLVYNLLVLICFFSKKRIKTLENRIYSFLLIINFFNIVIALMSFLTIMNAQELPFLNNCVSKTLIVLFATWVIVFTLYVYLISYNKVSNKEFEKSYKKFKKIILTIFGFVIILIYALPLYYFGENGIGYSYGPSANVVYALTTLSILSWLVMTIVNYKNIKSKKYLPVLIFIILIIIVVAIQKINPALLLITAMETFVTVIMYFTIENPDLYMIDELYKNKTLVEQTYEDKSNFLFEMTQEVRRPLFKIHNLCDELKTSNTKEELKKGIVLVDNYIKQLDFVVNDVLDVNSLDAQKLRVVNNKYNVNNLYNEIVINAKNCLSKNVEFRTKISNNIPSLYGDSIKLKQMVLSLLLDAVKRTKNGFIDFTIDSIDRFDVCRLIISIKSSSNGMSLEEINEILSSTGELSEEDINNIGKKEMSMQLCQKVVKLLGGTLMIKTNDELGFEMMLVIDQRVSEEKNKMSILDQYEYYVKKTKTVLVVCEDKDSISLLKKKFKSNGITASYLLNGKDALMKLNSGRKYDYILISDELLNMTGFELFKEMKKIKGFNIPVVIMLEKDKESIKEHYLNDGFSDYILLDNLGASVQEIIDKY